MSRATSVISGSYRRHYAAICELITTFEAQGFEVLSPPRSRIVNPGAEFVLFESDGIADAGMVERMHLAKIAQADFMFCFNPGGYVGANTALELGFAFARGVPIIALDYTGNPGLDCFIEAVYKPEEVGFYFHHVLAKQPRAGERVMAK